MSVLKIKQVSDTGEHCWGVELLDDKCKTILWSEKGMRKGEVTSVAKALKFEGSGTSVVEDGTEGSKDPTWQIEKTDQGWLVQCTPVTMITFNLMHELEEMVESQNTSEEVIKIIKECLACADIEWDPKDADPAHMEKTADQTETKGIPGSGIQNLTAEMEERLNEFVSWELAQIPTLENSVLLIFDYSPDMEQRPLSIAFDCDSGPKCWMTASKVQKIEGEGPDFRESYREFSWKGKEYVPYSIKNLPKSIFENIDDLKSVCRSLYRHVVWE